MGSETLRRLLIMHVRRIWESKKCLKTWIFLEIKQTEKNTKQKFPQENKINFSNSTTTSEFEAAVISMITPISPCIHCNWNFPGCRTQLLNIHFFHVYLTLQDDDLIWLWQFDESHIYIIFFTHLVEFWTFHKFIKTTTTLSWSWCHLKKPN